MEGEALTGVIVDESKEELLRRVVSLEAKMAGVEGAFRTTERILNSHKQAIDSNGRSIAYVLVSVACLYVGVSAMRREIATLFGAVSILAKDLPS